MGYPIAVCGMGKIDGRPLPPESKYLMEVQLHESASGKGCYDMSSTKKDSCNGDSGGPTYPLDSRGRPICLYGAVSYGSSKCSGWGVYTRVSYYRSWVQQFM